MDHSVEPLPHAVPQYIGVNRRQLLLHKHPGADGVVDVVVDVGDLVGKPHNGALQSIGMPGGPVV